MALTNDQTTIFETKTLRDARKTFDNVTLRDAKNKEEASQNIQMKIRRQYKEKLEVLENASKILKNLASVCPKVDALIELDEANTGLENKLFYSEFHVRKSPGYI